MICFDKRGTGLTDPGPGPATVEDSIADVRAVLDATGSTREGPCVLSITPPPVEPGGTVTLELGECEFPPEPEPEPEPDTGETTTEAG